MKSNKRDFWLTVIVLAVFAVLVVLVQTGVVTLVDSYQIHVLNLCAIYTILGLSMNLVNGFTGLFSLGQAGFMAIGAYVTALLIMEPDVKERVFYVEADCWRRWWPFSSAFPFCACAATIWPLQRWALQRLSASSF